MAFPTYESYNLDITTTPLYRDFPQHDLVLIGVVHRFDTQGIRNATERRQKFITEIQRAKHLIIEAEVRNNIPDNPRVIDFDKVVSIYGHQAQFHFLEDGTANYAEIAEKYGLKRGMLGIYNVFRYLSRISHLRCSDEEKIEILHGIMSNIRDNYGMSFIDVDDSLNKLRWLAANMPQTIGLAHKFGSTVFPLYSADMREYDILAPKTLELLARLDGKKREIVGAIHVDGLEKHIREENVEPPPEWEDLTGRLAPEMGGFIRLIERTFPG